MNSSTAQRIVLIKTWIWSTLKPRLWGKAKCWSFSASSYFFGVQRVGLPAGIAWWESLDSQCTAQVFRIYYMALGSRFPSLRKSNAIHVSGWTLLCDEASKSHSSVWKGSHVWVYGAEISPSSIIQALYISGQTAQHGEYCKSCPCMLNRREDSEGKAIVRRDHMLGGRWRKMEEMFKRR